MNFLVKIPSNYRGTYPLAGKALIFGSGILFLLSGYTYLGARDAQKQVDYRKEQLKLPIYKLSEDEHINPPWNKDNLKEWLYRRVEVSGRPIHRNACLVPHDKNKFNGYEYVLPLLVKEQEDRSNPQGLILSKGMIPFSARQPGIRYRIENANKQTFVGFVSQLEEFRNTSFLKGNTSIEGKLKFTSSDVQDFAKASQFVNPGAAVALVEVLRQTGSLDERNYARRDLDCTATTNYPYAKTQSGALQLSKMPWDYKNEAKKYFASGIFSLIIGASIF